MRMSSLQAISILCISLCSTTEAQQATMTVVTNPPVGGTITGGGTYSVGSNVSIAINANEIWYFANVLYSGPPLPPPNVSPAEQFYKLLTIDSVLYQPNFDPTTITYADLSAYLAGDCTVTAVFAPLAPTFGQQPENATAVAGNAVTLSGTASGRQPSKYQWQFDGTNIAGANSSALSFTNVALTNAGTDVLVASNRFGTNASAPAVLEVEDVDGRLDIKVSVPGGAGTGTNPEQLLAAGWSACFTSAIKIAAAKTKVRLPADLAIDAEVDLCTSGGGYLLQARLNVSLPGLEREVARALVDAAHQMCPYSKATRGNIDVAINLV
jgi:lipoyl-dependent peroxiredoxin